MSLRDDSKYVFHISDMENSIPCSLYPETTFHPSRRCGKSDTPEKNKGRSTYMKIIVDAMGGDNAPLAFLDGAFQAAKEYSVDIVLVGRVEQLLELMKKKGIETLPKGVELMDAEDVVDMHDDPANVVKTRRNSSVLPS